MRVCERVCVVCVSVCVCVCSRVHWKSVFWLIPSRNIYTPQATHQSQLHVCVFIYIYILKWVNYFHKKHDVKTTSLDLTFNTRLTFTDTIRTKPWPQTLYKISWIHLTHTFTLVIDFHAVICWSLDLWSLSFTVGLYCVIYSIRWFRLLFGCVFIYTVCYMLLSQFYAQNDSWRPVSLQWTAMLDTRIHSILRTVVSSQYTTHNAFTAVNAILYSRI